MRFSVTRKPCPSPGHAGIVLALKDEKRRADPRGMRQWRAFAVELRVLDRIAELTEEDVAQISTRRIGQRLQRNDSDDRHPGRESIGPKRERHEREVSAVALAIH